MLIFRIILLLLCSIANEKSQAAGEIERALQQQVVAKSVAEKERIKMMVRTDTKTIHTTVQCQRG